MMIAKSLLASAVVAASLGAGGVAHASNQAHLQSMVDSLATEFSLNSEDVENAVREFKGVRETRIAENGTDGQAHLVAFSAAFANEFGLDAAEVEAALQAYVGTRHEQRGMNSMSKVEKINRAVEQGRITQEQADALFAKHDEIVAFKASLEGMTPEEKKAAVIEFAQELAVWADDNEINLGARIGGNLADRMHARIEGHEDGNDLDSQAKLEKAVETGHLTEDQAAAITDMRGELVDFKASLDSMTQAERLAALKAQALEIQDWADENDIELGERIGEGRTDNLQNLKIKFNSQDSAPIPAPTPAPVE